jgi:hypothetical protein
VHYSSTSTKVTALQFAGVRFISRAEVVLTPRRPVKIHTDLSASVLRRFLTLDEVQLAPYPGALLCPESTTLEMVI